VYDEGKDEATSADMREEEKSPVLGMLAADRGWSQYGRSGERGVGAIRMQRFEVRVLAKFSLLLRSLVYDN
jgi:hypothetical protein